MIHIYYSYINEGIHNVLLETHLKKFPIDYQNKILRFRRWEDAQLSLLGRLLLIYGMKSLNKELSGYQLEYTDYCKPFFINLDSKFNISHSGNMVVCAISEEFDVGIDVELINDIGIESFKNQMTLYEWEKINNEEDKICAFYEYWTKKEAVVKAHGKGLSIPLKSFEIIEEKTFIKDSFFSVREILLHKDYKCSLALMVRNPIENVNSMIGKGVVIKRVCFEHNEDINI